MLSRLSFNTQLFILFAVSLAARIPFLHAGYGVEEDSWGIAVAMHNTVETGIPEASRLPGHPVHELFLAALWSMGARYWMFNFVSAVAGAVGVVFFAMILKKLSFKHYMLAALGFSLVPVIYIAGTYTIDYMWTITFVLASYYALLCNRLWLAGILLGLACGCRITSAAMMLPFAIQLWGIHDFKGWLARIFKIGIAALIIIVISYIPVVMVYGKSFFTYSDQFPYPPFSKIFYKGTIGVFGLIGFVAIILFALIALMKRQNKDQLYAQPLSRMHSYAWASTVIIYIIAYFGLPQKSAYMIPLVPFVLLLFTRYLDEKHYRIFSVLLILSPFFFSINLTDPFRGSQHSSMVLKATVSGQEVFLDPLTGPVFSDYTKRKQKMAFTKMVRKKANAMNEKAVIISGWWYNMIITGLYDEPGSKHVIYTFYTDEKALRSYLSQGYNIYYLPEQDLYNDLNFKMQVTNELAKPFIEEAAP
jgi:hypothetical protein